MKKILALLLALLMVTSIALTACTPGSSETGTEKGSESSTKAPEESKSEESAESSTESSTESATESATESKSESESDSSSALPTVADGNIVHVLINIPGFVEKDGDSEDEKKTVREYFNVTLEIEYNKADKTFRLVVSSDQNKMTDTDKDTVLADAYFDGTYLYMTVDGSMVITTPEVLIRSILNQASASMDASMIAMLESYLEKLMNGDIGGMPEVPDIDTLLGMLPEKYQELVRQILDLLPEGKVDVPEFPLPELKPEKLLAALLGLFEKTEGEDGGTVYTFDFTTVTATLTGVLDRVSALFEMTPAALIDQLAGKEGTYDQLFLLLSTSIKGDTTVGSLLDSLFLVLNSQGFRITDEKIVKLVETIISLTSGTDAPEGYVAGKYAELRKMTLDELLASMTGGDGSDGDAATDSPLTVAKLMEMLNTYMTGSTFADLIDMIGPDMSDKILAAVAQVKEALPTVSGSVCLYADKNNAIFRFTFDLTVGENIRASAEVSVSDTAVMPAPKDLPDVSGITVTKQEDGSLKFEGLPTGAKLTVELDGMWNFHANLGEVFESGDFSGIDVDSYVTVDGSTASVRLKDLTKLPEGIYAEQMQNAGNPEDAMFGYSLMISVMIKLEDGTFVLLYPVYLDTSVSGNITIR